jgi:hypothetical protein
MKPSPKGETPCKTETKQGICGLFSRLKSYILSAFSHSKIDSRRTENNKGIFPAALDLRQNTNR